MFFYSGCVTLWYGIAIMMVAWELTDCPPAAGAFVINISLYLPGCTSLKERLKATSTVPDLRDWMLPSPKRTRETG